MGRLPPNPWGDRRRVTVGILGGSFNPAHEGHRHVALTLLTRLGLDEVWLLVSPQNPLKPAAGMGSFASRLESARRIAGRHPRLRVTGMEAQFGTSFTADTVRALKRRFPCTRFVWLMGADNLLQVARWRRWASIFQTLPVAIHARGPYPEKALRAKAAHRLARYRVSQRAARTLVLRRPPVWVFIHTRLHAASATAIRRTGQWATH